MAIIRFLNEFEDKVEFNKINRKFLEAVVNSLNLDDEKSQRARELYEHNCKNVLKLLSENESILVNGEVQSGKTNNLITLASSINSNKKYDLIVYLTGRLNKINDQNHYRFFNIFESFEEEYIIKKVKNFNKESEVIVNHVRNGKTLLVNMLKESWRVKELVNYIKQNDFSFILINDEGDDGSLTSENRKIFSEMRNINVDKKIITITASPYNNLCYKELYDDYVVLKSSEYYTGISDFKYNVLTSDDVESNINYVVGKWIDYITGNKDKESHLLINVATKKIEHEKIANLIYERLDLLEFKYEDDPEFPKEIMNTIKDIKLSGKVQITNSDSDVNLNLKNMIIIGGHNLSRGVTFDNLTHQLLLSSPNQNKFKAATLIQKARWCGYRNVDQVNIYLNEYLNEAMEELGKLQEWTKEFDFKQSNYEQEFKLKNYLRLDLWGGNNERK